MLRFCLRGAEAWDACSCSPTTAWLALSKRVLLQPRRRCLPGMHLLPALQDFAALKEKYADKGLVIMAFPCNQVSSRVWAVGRGEV